MLDKGFASGTKLITDFQKVYGLGMLMSDGMVMSDGMLVSDSTFGSSSPMIAGDDTPGMIDEDDTSGM